MYNYKYCYCGGFASVDGKAGLCALACIWLFKAVYGLLWAVWYWDMGERQKGEKRPYKVIDGEAHINPPELPGMCRDRLRWPPGWSLPPCCAVWLAAGFLFGFWSMPNKPARIGTNRPRLPRLIPPAIHGAWFTFWSFFHFAKKVKYTYSTSKPHFVIVSVIVEDRKNRTKVSSCKFE